MNPTQTAMVSCQICKAPKPLNQVIRGALVSEAMVPLIQQRYPDWSPNGFICFSDLKRFQSQFVAADLPTGPRHINTLEPEVLASVQGQEILSANLNVEFNQQLSWRDRLTDRLTVFCGGWRFLISFTVMMIIWVLMNSLVLIWRPFDPYPFIFLNLIFSCMSSIQAPIILMSQNRQDAKDRLRAEHDYRISLKSELELHRLQEKIDHLLLHHSEQLFEIQALQKELLQRWKSEN
jgi:uncharacterized membrane protein